MVADPALLVDDVAVQAAVAVAFAVAPAETVDTIAQIGDRIGARSNRERIIPCTTSECVIAITTGERIRIG